MTNKSINPSQRQEKPIISDQIVFGKLNISDYNHIHGDHSDLWAKNFDVSGMAPPNNGYDSSANPVEEINLESS